MEKILFFSAITVVLTVVLCVYIYIKDRVEKEPILLLLLMFVLGATIFVPSYFAQNGFSDLVNAMFAEYMTYPVVGGAKFDPEGFRYLYYIVYSLLCAVLVEGLKWIALFAVTKLSKNFNCIFDGFVYSVYLSLGFGFVENIRYAMVDGWDTLLLRIATSIPDHFFYGIIMGMFYSLWFIYSKARADEKHLAEEKRIEKTVIKYPIGCLLVSLFAPMLTHAFSLFSRICENSVSDMIYYIYIGAMYIVCFMIVRYSSSKDSKNKIAVERILAKKHPELAVENGGEEV